MKHRSDKPAAFSLVELLVVIAIIAVLTALAATAFNSINSGRTLEQAGQNVAYQIALARQFALSKNRSIEVRFMKMKTEPNGINAFAAMQLSEERDDGSDLALGKLVKLPPGIVISETPELSSLLDANAMTKLDDASLPELPVLGKPDEVRLFRFKPSGTTDLANMAGNYYLTIMKASDIGKSPPNFVTIQIDPMNGVVRTLRP